MEGLKTNDLMFAAFAAAMSDVLAGCLAETRVLVETLERKGTLSAAEQRQAMQNIPPEQISSLAAIISAQLKTRMADHFRELSGSGTVQ